MTCGTSLRRDIWVETKIREEEEQARKGEQALGSLGQERGGAFKKPNLKKKVSSETQAGARQEDASPRSWKLDAIEM